MDRKLVGILKSESRDPRTAKSVRILNKDTGIHGPPNWSVFLNWEAGIHGQPNSFVLLNRDAVMDCWNGPYI